MTRAERKRDVVAQIAAIAAAFAEARRVDIVDAVIEIRECLAAAGIKHDTPAAADALTRAAAVFATTEARPADWWFPDAFHFLALMGADGDKARDEPRD
jgi:hypothetical protein